MYHKMKSKNIISITIEKRYSFLKTVIVIDSFSAQVTHRPHVVLLSYRMNGMTAFRPS